MLYNSRKATTAQQTNWSEKKERKEQTQQNSCSRVHKHTYTCVYMYVSVCMYLLPVYLLPFVLFGFFNVLEGNMPDRTDQTDRNHSRVGGSNLN